MSNSVMSWGYVRKKGDRMTGDLDMHENKINHLGAASVNGGATRYQQLESVAHNCVLLAGDTMSGNLAMGAGDTVDGVDIGVQNALTARLLTGTYTGDGNDNRSINVGVDLSAVTACWVVIKSTGTKEAVHRIEYAQGDLTMRFLATADGANEIQALNATGFQIGTSANVNDNGIVFRYAVLYIP